MIASPAFDVRLEGAPWLCSRVDLSSTAERTAAVLRPLKSSRPATVGATVTIAIRGVPAYSGTVFAIRRGGSDGVSVITESPGSRAMSDQRATVAAGAWTDVRAAVVLGHVFDALPVDAQPWPELMLPRFSLPPCSVSWAVAALARACDLTFAVRWAVDAAGALRIGVLPDLVRDAGAAPVPRAAIFRQTGALYVTPAMPARYAAAVTLDGLRGWVSEIRTVAQGSLHRSTVILQPLP